MRIKTLVLGICFFLILPLIAKEEEVAFESILKDADFCPLSSLSNPLLPLEIEDPDPVGWDGWWTLKFENGAVITINRSWTKYPKWDIWWIGKEYKVVKEKYCFLATLIEKEKNKKTTVNKKE